MQKAAVGCVRFHWIAQHIADSKMAPPNLGERLGALYKS